MNRRWPSFFLFLSVLSVAAIALVAVSCSKIPTNDPRSAVAVTEPAGDPQFTQGPPFFKEVTADSGIKFTYHNGEEANHMAILESLGGGIGLIDYDGDGLLDVFIPGGGYYDGPDKKEIKGHPCKLYKNLGNYKFKDVTAEVGLDNFPWFYSHGVAVGDFDRDGWPDILLTGWGRVALFHNEPVDPTDPSKGRKFTDVSEKAGLKDITWATSAGWADFDGDGFPDLYLCQYTNWSFNGNHPTDCKYDGKTRDVCPPKKFEGLRHKLFKNNGNGTFSDMSYDKDCDLNPGGRTSSKGLGVLLVPMRGHGQADIYVANDTVPKFLYENKCTLGKFKFKELGTGSGAVVDESGGPNGSMGLACGDYDGTGKVGLFVTNYEGEMNALYKNLSTEKRISFSYQTVPSGLAAMAQVYVGWGTAFVDLDHHGWEDLVFVNGHAIMFPTGAGVTRAQKSMLMRNDGGKFKEMSARGGDYFQKPHLSRGVAFGDLNNTGGTDMIVNNMNEYVAVLQNVADTGKNHWLGIELVGKDHADFVGARISVVAGSRTFTRFAIGGGSYASSSDRRHVFGLGESDKAGKLTVIWPNGEEQHWDTVPAVDQYYRITQGAENLEPLAGK
jgi:enediyne biosynthesis protein E4